MVADCQSRFAGPQALPVLAADQPSAAQPLPTSPSINTPSSRTCAYKTASGRGKWPERDPSGQKGGLIERDYAWIGSSWAETNEIHYVYDGNLVFQERDANNNPVTTYTRGTDLSGTFDGAGGIGGLLARSDAQRLVPTVLVPSIMNPQGVVNSYYYSDANGNVTALVSPSGVLLAQYEYDPFGNMEAMSGLMAAVNKYRFSSKEWNDNPGLYYYGHRFYEPNLQRWVNRDPLGDSGSLVYAMLDGKNCDLITSNADESLNQHLNIEGASMPNLFAFAGNMPISCWDAFGLSKGDKQNLSCEGFTKRSNPTEVQEALNAAKAAGQVRRVRALRALLKVIKRGGSMVWLFIDLQIQELENLNQQDQTCPMA